jgi:hypothetical protein
LAGALNRRQRSALVVGIALVTILAAITPHLDAPFRRLAKYHAENGDPVTTAVVDIAAIKQARAILPSGSSYYIELPTGPGAAQLRNDLDGVTLMYFLPSLRVNNARNANWVLAYGVGTKLPSPTKAVKRYDLGGDVYLVRIR